MSQAVDDERALPSGAPEAPPGPPSWWEDGREPALLVVLAAAAAQATLVLADLALTGRISQLGDLCFVVICLAMGVAVRPDQAFTVACWPLVLMVVTMAVLGAAAPGAVAHASDAWVQAAVTGLARHSASLVAGFVLCLVVVGLRWRSRPRAVVVVDAADDAPPRP